jgi:hypothetical protein
MDTVDEQLMKLDSQIDNIKRKTTLANFAPEESKHYHLFVMNASCPQQS